MLASEERYTISLANTFLLPLRTAHTAKIFHFGFCGGDITLHSIRSCIGKEPTAKGKQLDVFTDKNTLRGIFSADLFVLLTQERDVTEIVLDTIIV